MSPVQVTFLNRIAGADFPDGICKQASIGLKLLDIKDGIWGQRIEEID
ncbi:MAG: hypothetical protein H7067_01165, partial [Burkholderiales bacterium]|nr:hypothetical protein [Opitutaceae bacterium]